MGLIDPVLALGAVCWLVTTILVESELCRPLRDRLARWSKLHYLSSCALCTGTWVGLVLAAVTPYRPIASPAPFVSWLLAGLLYKAIGHLILAANNTLRRFS